MTKTIALSRGKRALVDDRDHEWLSQWKWSVLKGRTTWYAVRRDCSRMSPTLLYMHRQILNSQPGQRTHHINSNGLDNRRANIIKCSRSEHATIHPRRGTYVIRKDLVGTCDDSDMGFAKTLRSIRLMRRMRQKDLADLLGVSDFIISAIETGKMLPTPDLEARLRKALDWTELEDKAFESMSLRRQRFSGHREPQEKPG